jgi:hypothetical protein
MANQIKVTNISHGSITLPDGTQLRSFGSWAIIPAMDKRVRAFAVKKMVRVEEVVSAKD